MKKKPLNRRDYAAFAVASVLLIINPFDGKWFESQGFHWFPAILIGALIVGVIFGVSFWAFGCYRKPKN